MPTLIAGVVAVIVLYSLLQMFRAANPAVLARAIRIAGGVLALAVAAFTGVKGELAVAIPLGIFGAAALYALDHHLQRLAEDHANARAFAQRVRTSAPVELDLATVPVLRERLESLVPGSASPLVIDLSAVTFIGSAGLALLVETHNHCREHGTSMALVACGTVVPRAIQVTALDQVFAVHTTLDAAIGDPA